MSTGITWRAFWTTDCRPKILEIFSGLVGLRWSWEFASLSPRWCCRCWYWKHTSGNATLSQIRAPHQPSNATLWNINTHIWATRSCCYCQIYKIWDLSHRVNGSFRVEGCIGNGFNNVMWGLRVRVSMITWEMDINLKRNIITSEENDGPLWLNNYTLKFLFQR